MKVSVVIPAYNPDEKLLSFLHDLVDHGFTDIVVIDDGSKAETQPVFDEVRKFPECTLLVHEVNMGKGRGLKTAFAYLEEQRPDIDGAVTADSDGQHTVESIERCLAKFEEDPQAVVIGGRDFSDRKHIPWRSRVGNNISSVIYRFACGIKLKDTQTGLRVLPRSSFAAMSKLKGDRYEYETNMLIAVKNMDLTYYEVPIETIYIDDNASSHFNPFKDSIRIYITVLRGVFKYILNSLICWVVDEGLFYLMLTVLTGAITSPHVLTYTSVAIARVVSSAINFTLNRKTVFKSHESVVKTAAKYYALAICQMLVSAILVDLFAVSILGVSGILEVIVKCVVDVILFLVSYTVQRKWVFKKKEM